MSMDYIRKTYGVPAKRGGQILFYGGLTQPLRGVITGAKSGRLRVRLENTGSVASLHPTHEIEYI